MSKRINENHELHKLHTLRPKNKKSVAAIHI